MQSPVLRKESREEYLYSAGGDVSLSGKLIAILPCDVSLKSESKLGVASGHQWVPQSHPTCYDFRTMPRQAWEIHSCFSLRQHLARPGRALHVPTCFTHEVGTGLGARREGMECCCPLLKPLAQSRRNMGVFENRGP